MNCGASEPSSVRPAAARLDQSETQSMPSQAGRPKAAVLLDSQQASPVCNSAPCARRAAHHQHGAADGYTSIPLGRDSNHVNFVNQISTAQIRTPIRPAVSPCVLLLRSVATLDFKCEFANKYWLQQHRDQCFTSRGSAMEVGSYGMKWPTPGRRSVHSKCRNPLHEAVTCRPSEKARQWWSCNESLKQW